MKLRKTTALYIDAGILELEHKSASDALVAPWRDALLQLKAGRVESASEIASRAYGNGASLDVRREVIDLISQVAVENDLYGHWYESLLLLAAEGGLSHCAYNVGHLITERATSAEDHLLAHRYYTQAALNATDPRVKASALANSCTAVRDGLITGTPDWEKAVEIYGQAGELNLAFGMFNAANVSFWLKENGKPHYAAIAVKWLTRLIDAVDAGEAFVDIGGDDDVKRAYLGAKSLLAELHAMEQVAVVDPDFILAVANDDPAPERGAWLRNRGYLHKLLRSPIDAKPTAWENWLSILNILGWELSCPPSDLRLGPDTGDSRLLSFKRNDGPPLNLAIVDLDEVESNGGIQRLFDLAMDMQAEHDGPCLAIGAKGLFIQLERAGVLDSYTVLVTSDKNGKPSLIPIWPGATTDAVAKLIEGQGPLYTAGNVDYGNTIPILINALGSGNSVDGTYFPAAIYVNVGGYFYSPVLSVEQALSMTQHMRGQLEAADYASAFENQKAQAAAIRARRNLYLAEADR